jgi:hypothetical protein
MLKPFIGPDPEEELPHREMLPNHVSLANVAAVTGIPPDSIMAFARDHLDPPVKLRQPLQRFTGEVCGKYAQPFNPPESCEWPEFTCEQQAVFMPCNAEDGWGAGKVKSSRAHWHGGIHLLPITNDGQNTLTESLGPNTHRGPITRLCEFHAITGMIMNASEGLIGVSDDTPVNIDLSPEANPKGESLATPWLEALGSHNSQEYLGHPEENLPADGNSRHYTNGSINPN